MYVDGERKELQIPLFSENETHLCTWREKEEQKKGAMNFCFENENLVTYVVIKRANIFLFFEKEKEQTYL